MSDVDFESQVQSVYRQVVEKDDKCVVVLERTYLESDGEIWAALTDPDKLAEWFDVVEGDLKPEGRFRLAMTGTEGTIELCDIERALNLTWENGDDDAARVEISLTPTQQGTSLTLRHTSPANEHWETFGPAATGVGWDGAFLSLALFLARDPRSTPEEMARLMQTDGGKKFIDDLADSWAEAHVAAGAEEEPAREAARNAATFYKGEEPAEDEAE